MLTGSSVGGGNLETCEASQRRGPRILPENVAIYGKTGTGKSLVSKHVCQRAQNAAQEGVDIGTAYVDCAEDNTETQAISSLAAN